MRNRHAQKMYSAILTVVSSTYTSAPHQNLGRPEHNQKVKSNREVLEIKQIVREFFRIVLDRRAVAMLDLGPSCQTWRDRPAEPVVRYLFRQFFFLFQRERARAHEMHISPQDVVELRKFIEM